MPYCTKQDLIDRGLERELIERTGGNATNTINDAVLNKAIADAAATIDGELSTFTRPITPVTPRLLKIACDLTRYYLYGNRDVPEYVKSAHDEALAFLIRANKGNADLGVDAQGAAPVEQVVVMQSSAPKLFGRQS